jgi:uncharacterized membrane protein YtjA (UPF0391 family)
VSSAGVVASKGFIPQSGKGKTMGNLLHWAVVFIVVAIIAAFLGFGGVAGTAMGGAQMLFYAAIALLVIGALVGLIRRA